MAQLYGQQSVVIPQITIPNGMQRYEPLIVKGEDAARKIYTPPGTRVPIFDEVDEVFYFKETDSSGNIISFDTYSYSKIEPPPPPQYATVQDLNRVLEELSALREDLRNGKFVRTQDHNRSGNGNSQNRQQPTESK